MQVLAASSNSGWPAIIHNHIAASVMVQPCAAPLQVGWRKPKKNASVWPMRQQPLLTTIPKVSRAQRPQLSLSSTSKTVKIRISSANKSLTNTILIGQTRNMQTLPSYTFNSTCAGTVGPAIICFLESKDYVDCIKLAISLGGDADTLAAIAGPMAYAYYKKMPDALVYQALKKLPDWMVDVSERFDGIVNSSSKT